MFVQDDTILVLAQRIRHSGDKLKVDAIGEADIEMEGDLVEVIQRFLQTAHLKTVYQMRKILWERHSMKDDDFDDMVFGLFDLGLMTTARHMGLTANKFAMNPPVAGLTFRTMADYRLIVERMKMDQDEGGALSKSDSQFDEVLGKRKSIRRLANTQVEERLVQQMIHAGYGAMESTMRILETEIPNRTIPSAGALYPCRLRALYKCDDEYKTFLLSHDGKRVIMQNDCVNTDDVDESFLQKGNRPVIFVISIDYEMATVKYGARGWQYALIEAGHIAQNLNLQAQQLDLALCEIGGFREDAISDVLNLQELEIPVLSIICGYEQKAPREKVRNDILFAYHGYGKIVPFVKCIDRDDRFHPYAYYASGFSVWAPEHRGYEEPTIPIGASADDQELATIKAVAEGVERFAAGIPNEPSYVGSANNAKSGYLHPVTLQMYAFGTQIPRDIKVFDPDHSHDWYAASQWGGQKQALVLGDFLFYPYVKDKENRIAFANSNGMAAYPTLEGSVRRAAYELLEREALLVWWHSGVRPPLVNEEKTTSLKSVISAWNEIGFNIRFLEISIEVPTVACVALNPASKVVVVSSASDLTIAQACKQALDEVARSLTLHGDTREISTPEEVIDMMDHMSYFWHGNEFEFADWWSSGTNEKAVVDDIASDKDALNQLVDAFEALWYVTYSIPEEIYGPQALTVTRVLLPGVTSLKFGYGEQDLGLPRCVALMKQCRERSSEKSPHAPPLVHPMA